MVPQSKSTNIEVCARIRPLLNNSSNDGSLSNLRSPSLKSRLNNPSRRRILDARRKTSLNKEPSSSNRDSKMVAWNVLSDDTVQQSEQTERVQGRTISYTLDRVYPPEATTDDLYSNSVKKLVLATLQGYHASVFAYGQTSTGKTYTMTGSNEHPGIVPQAINEVFDYINNSQDAREYLIRVSYLEIYNEQINDLLSSTPSSIRLMEGRDGVVVRGCREEVVTTPTEVFHFLKKGEARRQVGSTNMNKHSSRSHTIVRLWLESTSPQQTVVSSLSLVDLAGSESVRLTGATGERQREGQYINKSLMALGQVVFKLSEKSKSHIPYRDSKLTRLLQPSLSGNAHIAIICNISPSTSHIEESHNTLKFAQRAKKVQQRAVVNKVAEESTLLQSYREEIEDLKQQLAASKALQEKQQPSYSVNNGDDVKELVGAIQKMESLILKTKTLKKEENELDHLLSPEPSMLAKELKAKVDSLDSDDDNDEEMLVSDLKPVKSKDDALTNEMHRIQGLLGAMLTKRNRPVKNGSVNIDASRNDEVEVLRAKLEEQQVTTNLSKADSSFLQSQLQEKDALLEEVSKIMEAVEHRQIELEDENAKLQIKLVEKDKKIAELEKRVAAKENFLSDDLLADPNDDGDLLVTPSDDELLISPHAWNGF